MSALERRLLSLVPGDPVRRDVAWVSLKQGRIRMALVVIFLPPGYSIEKKPKRERPS